MGGATGCDIYFDLVPVIHLRSEHRVGVLSGEPHGLYTSQCSTILPLASKRKMVDTRGFLGQTRFKITHDGQMPGRTIDRRTRRVPLAGNNRPAMFMMKASDAVEFRTGSNGVVHGCDGPDARVPGN